MEVKCKFCSEKCVKNGFQNNGCQRYKCIKSNKKQQDYYKYNAYRSDINQNIVIFTKEGLGIRSTARILKISTTTLLKRILMIAKNIPQPIIHKGKIYEVDEMCTCVGHKKNYLWIVYALERHTKRVASFSVGRRTNKTLSKVIDILKLSEAKKIVTDKLKNYRYLIEKQFHWLNDLGQIILNDKI